MKLSWKIIDLFSLQIKKGLKTSKPKQNRMLKNVCRFMDIINEKTQHVTSPIALLSSMYCSKYDALKYIHIAEALGPYFNDLAIGCCILSRSMQFPSLHTIVISIVVCVLHQVFYLCFQEVSKKGNGGICLMICKEQKLCIQTRILNTHLQAIFV